MKNLWRTLVVLALFGAVTTLGLAACKSTKETPPAPQDQPAKSEHPEHPK